jgi:hypothetical protein
MYCMYTRLKSLFFLSVAPRGHRHMENASFYILSRYLNGVTLILGSKVKSLSNTDSHRIIVVS